MSTSETAQGGILRVGLEIIGTQQEIEIGTTWPASRFEAISEDADPPDSSIEDEEHAEATPEWFRLALLDEISSLRRFAWSLVRDRDKADDVVHDCLVRALGKWQSFCPGTNLRAWLMAILHHTFVSDVRRRRPQGTEPASWDTIRLADHDETVRLQLRDLERGLTQLPREQSTTLLLIVVEGMSYEEAAKVTGVPVGTIRSRLSRARQGLRRYLEEEPQESGNAPGEGRTLGRGSGVRILHRDGAATRG